MQTFETLGLSEPIVRALTESNITALNPMQEQAHKTITELSDMVLLSPTGTGKTLAFLLPLIAQLDPTCDEIQILILVPSRELAQQIEQVARKPSTFQQFLLR